MIGRLLKQEIEATFQVVPHKSTEEELVFLCPECGDKSGHRSVNLTTGATFCFRCGKGKANKGHLVAWAAQLGVHFANRFEGTNLTVDQIYAPQAERMVPVVKPVKLPKGFIPMAKQPKSVYTELIVEMAERKNLLKEDMLGADVGFTREDPIWEPFAIFPVKEHGVTCYYQGRTYIDVPGETTKKFPKRTECPFGASFWVYNIDALRQPHVHTAVVVESILNVLSLRWKFAELGWTEIVPVCVFKHHMSVVQAIKLVRCDNVREVCMMFDHDAIDATWSNIGSLNNRLKVTVAEMPSTPDNKKLDPNDDVDAAIAAYRKRTLYTYGSAVTHHVAAKKETYITGKISSWRHAD